MPYPNTVRDDGKEAENDSRRPPSRTKDAALDLIFRRQWDRSESVRSIHLSASGTSQPTRSPIKLLGSLFSVPENPQVEYLKVVVSGDLEAKKTELLTFFKLGYFPPQYVPVVIENYTIPITLNGTGCEASLWDTTGQESFQTLRQLTYSNADVVIICYSVMSPESLQNISDKWHPEVARVDCVRALVGTEIHLRDSKIEISDFVPTGEAMSVFKPVTTEEGIKVARSLGLSVYGECNYLTGDGVDDLFFEVISAAIKGRPRRSNVHAKPPPLRITAFTRGKKSRIGNKPASNGPMSNRDLRKSYESLSTLSYFSARSSFSVRSRESCRSYRTAVESFSGNDGEIPAQPLTPWLQHLEAEALILPPDKEINWSGKGQHVEFEHKSEIPLVHERILGHSASALVDSVRCRRVCLARKSIICSRRLKKEDFLEEVKHLNRLRHPHIIQLVGTYLLGRTFAILLYPVGDYTLDAYMESCGPDGSSRNKILALQRFPRCLAAAMSYIHSTNTKHMDIKPKNILICSRPGTLAGEIEYRVYLADFGISRNYSDPSAIETDSPICFTRTYCAPEVASQQVRGIAADTYSLGCVFAEIYNVLAGRTMDSFADAREGEVDASFHNNKKRVIEWMEGLEWKGVETRLRGVVVDLIERMLDDDPQKRPEAKEIEAMLKVLDESTHDCCFQEPEAYQYAE